MPMSMGMKAMGGMAARGGTGITAMSHQNYGGGKSLAGRRQKKEDEKEDMTVGGTGRDWFN